MSKRDELHQLPLYQKAEQIYKITRGLVELFLLTMNFFKKLRFGSC